MSSALRSSLFSQRLLIHVLLSGVWQLTSWPSHISAASSWEVFSPLLVHFLFTLWLTSHWPCELWIVTRGGKAACHLTRGSPRFDVFGSQAGMHSRPRERRGGGAFIFSYLFPGRRGKHVPWLIWLCRGPYVNGDEGGKKMEHRWEKKQLQPVLQRNVFFLQQTRVLFEDCSCGGLTCRLSRLSSYFWSLKRSYRREKIGHVTVLYILLASLWWVFYQFMPVFILWFISMSSWQNGGITNEHTL